MRERLAGAVVILKASLVRQEKSVEDPNNVTEEATGSKDLE